MAVTDIGLLCAAGLVGGFVNAIAGGGSLVLFPALVATGLSSVAANVTNSVALWPGYIGTLFGLGSLVHDQAKRARSLAPTSAVEESRDTEGQGCRVTPGRGNPMESATESRPPTRRHT